MGCNVRIPIMFGELKIKSYSRLRRSELRGEVPVTHFGGLYFVWRPHESGDYKEITTHSGENSPDEDGVSRLTSALLSGLIAVLIIVNVVLVMNLM